jgi:hypothetical protein
VINRFDQATKTTVDIPFPPSFGETLGNLKFIVESLPKEKLDFQRKFTFPNETSHSTNNPPISQKMV